MGLKHYKAAIRRNNKKPGWYYNMGLCLYDLGNYEMSSVSFNAALKLDSQMHQAYFGLATLQMHLQDWQSALDNFLKAVELSPDTAEYHNSAGYTYQYMGMDRPAKKHFEIAVKLNQGCTEAYLNLGAMYDQRGIAGDRRRTYVNLTKALKIDPFDLDARHNLVYLSLDAQIYTMKKIDLPFPDIVVWHVLKQCVAQLARKGSEHWIISPKNIFVLDNYLIKIFNLSDERYMEFMAPEVRQTSKITNAS